MKANEFIKMVGFCQAKSIAIKSGYHHEVDVYLVDTKEFTYIAIEPDDNDPFVSLKELKALIESWELVESFGGLGLARKEAHKNCFDFNAPLLKAILDVESCQ